MLENRRDREATLAAKFHSRRSWISFAGHYYLEGEADHAKMRLIIFVNANGMCQTCAIPHPVPWNQGEWHHAQKTYGGRRCDGPCCGKWSCEPSHPKMRVLWTKKNSA